MRPERCQGIAAFVWLTIYNNKMRGCCRKNKSWLVILDPYMFQTYHGIDSERPCLDFLIMSGILSHVAGCGIWINACKFYKPTGAYLLLSHWTRRWPTAKDKHAFSSTLMNLATSVGSLRTFWFDFVTGLIDKVNRLPRLASVDLNRLQ